MVQHGIILFDGVCNLCNSAVRFVIRRDSKGYFLFASMQSEEGKRILAENSLPLNGMDSFFLIENGKVYDRSTAALKVARKLGGLWPLVFGFIIVPKFIRDSVYRIVSRNRYRWFGKRNECMMPTPGLSARFLN